jgi:hypothetical protein
MSREKLLKRAKELGVPISSGIYKPSKQSVNEIEITEYELHRRILEEERHRREHRLWIAAAVAATFAGLSAIAAWWAILYLGQI